MTPFTVGDIALTQNRQKWLNPWDADVRLAAGDVPPHTPRHAKEKP